MIPASVWEGEVRTSSHEEADHVWCAIVARGRIVERTHDGERGYYRLHLVLVAHPDLDEGEVYALFFMADGAPRCYRTTPADARAALRATGAFNLA